MGVAKVRSYRDLLVWQKAMALVADVYRRTRGFPRHEVFGLTAQMRSAAVSVPCNIAEGQARKRADFVRFLDMATGSVYELQTQIQIARNLDYLDETGSQALDEATRELERMINSLTRRLRTL
jgi:four helix bundle protein